MPRRHVLYVDATHLAAYGWRAGEVTLRARFANDADGHAQFAEFLRQRRDSLYLMLCDLVDEAFVAENVPYVTGADRAALIRRKLAQHFFGTPYTCARSLGRQRAGRRDEQMLFCALTRPAVLEPWLNALRTAEVALSGIHSLPLAGETILERLRLTEGQTLLLGISPAGVRQSFFEGGRLRFSRLTPLTALSSNDLPRACAEEARRLHPYLLGQRLISRSEPLTVRVLVPPARVDDFALACRSNDALRFELIDSSQTAARLGLRPAPPDADSETLFVQALMRRTPAEQFAPAAERRFHRIWLTRFALRAAGSVALAACLLYATHSALDSLELRQDTQRLADDTLRAQRQRHDIIQRLPPTPVPLDTLRAVHERSLQIEQRSAHPVTLLADLGQVLDQVPQVALDRLEWRMVSEAGGNGASAVGGVTAGAGNGGGMRADLVMQAHLPQEFGSQQRRALEVVDTLGALLRARPGVQVQVLRQPFDLESGQVLRGGTRAEQLDAGSPPPFSLRISRTVNPS